MVELLDTRCGVTVWVHETRVQEYLARGYKLAEPPIAEAPAKPKPARKPKAPKE